MLYVVPQPVIDFLNEQSTGSLKTAANVPSKLPDTPTPGIESGCPRCGASLGIQNKYVGGRGYMPYEVCLNFDCDYGRRA